MKEKIFELRKTFEMIQQNKYEKKFYTGSFDAGVKSTLKTKIQKRNFQNQGKI